MYKITIYYIEGKLETIYSDDTGSIENDFVTWSVTDKARNETKYITIPSHQIRRIEEQEI